MIRKSKTNSYSPIDDVAKLILYHPDKFSLDRLAKESCLSIRQFQRQFSERIGVSHKWFCRISRFDKAFRLKANRPHLDWLRIAIETGYHDYQHLSKDFIEFADTLPNSLIHEAAHPTGILGLKNNVVFLPPRNKPRIDTMFASSIRSAKNIFF